MESDRTFGLALIIACIVSVALSLGLIGAIMWAIFRVVSKYT